MESHPTMGAWIEIFKCEELSKLGPVAPHDGCVDWNRMEIFFCFQSVRRTPRWVRGLKFSIAFAIVPQPLLSHPTMGAWIEIISCSISCWQCKVAPHDGCVDWNFIRWVRIKWVRRRTPRWVRGLKLLTKSLIETLCESHPTMGAWIEIIALVNVMFVLFGRTPRWVRGLKFL